MSTKTVKNAQILSGEDYIQIALQSFLHDRKAQNLTKGTVGFYRYNLKIFADYLDTQQIRYVSEITSNDIRDFLLLLSERGHNAGGILVFYRVIKTFLKWHWEEHEPNEKNPIDRIKSPKVPDEPIIGVTREQFDTLLAACGKDNFVSERNRTLLMVLLDTGVRASELTNIRISDVNLAENAILILQGKGRKPRFVFYGKNTRKQIRRYLKFRDSSSIWLFTNRSGDKLVFAALREIIRRLCNKTGIQHVSLHSFRRAFCLECLRKGIPEITIARLMGAYLNCIDREICQTNDCRLNE